MRKLGQAVIWLMACYSSLSAGLTLEGQTFPATNVDIVWKAPTNALPGRIWVYKCVPQEFSPKVISHLMALGNFTEKDQTRIQGQRSFKEKRIRYFADTARTRHLGIFPDLGWIDYVDESADHYRKERAQGVPSESETLELARKLLQN